MNQPQYIIGEIVRSNEDSFYGIISINAETGLIRSVQPYSKQHADIPAAQIIYRAKDHELILPGMVDLHIHAREDETGIHNYKEDYQTVADAALNGGVVKIAAMPNTPSPLIHDHQLAWHRQRVENLQHPVGIINYIGIGPGTRPLAGKFMYKLYTGPSVGPLFFKNAEELEDTLQHYAGQNISFHVEDFDELQRHKKEATHSLRRPESCVFKALLYLLPLIEKYRIQAKLCHWPVAGESFELIAVHRERLKNMNLGYNTTLEVSPMHLLFDEDITARNPFLWPYLQMNPALREPYHREKLTAGLKSGFIDFLATDHAPHAIQEKFKQFETYKHNNESNPELTYLRLKKENPELCRELCCRDGVSGATWLDTYTAVTCHLVSECGFTWQDIARCTSDNPGRFLNPYLDEQKYGKGFGKIQPDFRAALTIINTSENITIRRDMLKTKAGWSPLEGYSFKGRLSAVIIGKQVFKYPQSAET